MTGFEPATPWSQTKCSTKLNYIPVQEVGVEPTTLLNELSVPNRAAILLALTCVLNYMAGNERIELSLTGLEAVVLAIIRITLGSPEGFDTLPAALAAVLTYTTGKW